MVDSKTPQRIADYFLVVGLGQDKAIIEEADSSLIKEPITDIAILNHGEKPPPGYEVISRTPAGFPADLNSSKHFLPPPPLYICYKRGSDKAPIVDISIHNPNRILPARSDYVTYARRAQTANISDTSNTDLYITYKTATSNSLSHTTLVVVDIQVINESKGETPPHLYFKIRTSTNVGTLSHKIHICYKKTSLHKNYVTCKPEILYRFPPKDYPDYTLEGKFGIENFCLTTGAVVEEWNSPVPPLTDGQGSVCTFVLTDQNVRLTYGTVLIFYEEIPREELTDKIREQLNMNEEKEEAMMKRAYTNKAICILSQWPFFKPFEMFLRFLQRKSTIYDSVPLERYLCHFLLKVPFPSIERPRVHVYLNHNEDAIQISRPSHGQLPVYGARFTDFFFHFDNSDSFIELFLLVLLEEKLLLHSLMPSICVSVAECIISLIFPLQWQSYYNPLCPLKLGETLMAPMGVIAGIDSRYFEMYDPPDELHCYDIDSRQLRNGNTRYPISLKILPKKILSTLTRRMMHENDKMNKLSADLGVRKSEEFDKAIKNGTLYAMRRQSIETGIQDAFLQFMASILKGYREYLKPIKTAPSKDCKDIHNIFDIAGFIKSKGSNCQQFYTMLCETMMFRQFIFQRSFISSQDQLLAFFDTCVDRIVDVGKPIQLLKYNDDPVSGERQSTLVVQPPDETGIEIQPDHYTYSRFPTKNLDPNLYTILTESPNVVRPTMSPSAANRTASDKMNTVKKMEKASGNPKMWARMLLGHCFTVWFVYLPAYIKTQGNTDKITKALNQAFDILCEIPKNYEIKFPDEVCYRVLIELCGQFGHPALAVKVFDEMKKQGVTPDAVTYGHYHKAVLEGTWQVHIKPAERWQKLKIVFKFIWTMKDGSKRRREQEAEMYEEAPLIDFGDSDEKMKFVADLSTELRLTNGERDRTISGQSVDSGVDAIELTCKSDRNPDDQPQSLGSSLGIAGSQISIGSPEQYGDCGSLDTNSTFDNQSFNEQNTDRPPEVAVECLMTSCFRCNNCSRFLYDENIMAGWSSDDSNYTTVCCFCEHRQLASLSITVRDWRGCYLKDSNESGRSSSQSSLGSSCDNNSSAFDNRELYGSSSSLPTSCGVKSKSNSFEDLSKKFISTLASSFSPPSSLPIAIKRSQRANSISAPSSSHGSPSGSLRSSPKLNYAFGSYQSRNMMEEFGYTKIRDPEEKDVVIAHYLSPLVLRKSLENLIEKKGDSCLLDETLVSESSHIFWNMVWYFKRLNLPSHLPDLLLRVYAPDPSYQPDESMPQTWETETLICPNWDCERMLDEPLPPYIIWCAPPESDFSQNKEAVSTPRSVLQTIVSHLKRNDFVTAINIMLDERIRQKRMSDNVRWTVYRELLFLYVASLGVHNMDAFDKEYNRVYKRLSKEPYTKLGKEDQCILPDSKAVYIRRLFNTPELYVNIPQYLSKQVHADEEGYAQHETLVNDI